MFPNDYDDGFEFFDGNIQQQYFNYYAYTQIADDDPLGLFGEPNREKAHHYNTHSEQYRPTTHPKPFTRKYENYLRTGCDEDYVNKALWTPVIILAGVLLLMFASVLI